LQEISQLIKHEQENAKFNSIVSSLEKYIPQVNSMTDIENYHMRIF